MEILDFNVMLPAFVVYKNENGDEEKTMVYFNPKTSEVITFFTAQMFTMQTDKGFSDAVKDYLKAKPGKWFVPPVPERVFDKIDPKTFTQK